MPQKKLPFRPRSAKDRREQARTITDQLEELYPHVEPFLDFRNSFELLVATVLSAQTLDSRVNTVTPELFGKYPDAKSLAAASVDDLERILRPVGFYRAKARSVQSLSQTLVNEFGGEVPGTMEELTTLRGVGRKTANVVLSQAFGVPGITVDTHVGRSARRWAWTRHTDPVKAEMDIAQLLPPEIWTQTCLRIIQHARSICHSRSPECGRCPLAYVCPSYELLSPSVLGATEGPKK